MRVRSGVLCPLLAVGSMAMAQAPKPKGDAIFDSIERMQARIGRPWGRFLDAGTGRHSLHWISTIETEAWTAVTAAQEMAVQSRDSVRGAMREQDRVVVGNWDDDTFLEGETFDVILADYLIGAMDGFSPYKQDLIFERLQRHLAEDGILYIVGLEPIPDSGAGAADVICEVRRMRDAMILLAGHRCYREYPIEWIYRQCRRSGFEVMESLKFPILYSRASITRQLDVGRRKLPLIRSRHGAATALALSQACDALQHRIDDATNFSKVSPSGVTADTRIRFGFDYVMVCQRSGRRGKDAEDVVKAAEDVVKDAEDVVKDAEDVVKDAEAAEPVASTAGGEETAATDAVDTKR